MRHFIANQGQNNEICPGFGLPSGVNSFSSPLWTHLTATAKADPKDPVALFERNVQLQSQTPAQQPGVGADSVAGGSRDFSSIPSNVGQTCTGQLWSRSAGSQGGRALRNTREYYFDIRGSRIKPSVLLLRLRSCASEPISVVDLRGRGGSGPMPYFGVLLGHFSRGRVFWFSHGAMGLSVYGNGIHWATGHGAVPKRVPAGLLMAPCNC